MHDNDLISDSAVLRELRDSFSAVAMPERPHVKAITARGRAHRRHRLSGLAGLSVAGAAAGTALVPGLTGVPGSAPAPKAGTIRTPAFTIVRNPHRPATLTTNPQKLLDPPAPQADRAQ